MSGMVKVAGQPPSTVRQGPVKLLIGAALVATIGVSGFAVGRATSDQPAAAGGGTTQAATRASVGDSAATRDQQRRSASNQLASPVVAVGPVTFGHLIGHRPGH